MKKAIQMTVCFTVLSLLVFSCRKDTALTTDRVPPKVTLRIQGNGNDNSFEANGAGMSPNGEYIYKENTRYNFTVTITDTSGLGQLIFKLDKSAAISEFTLNGAPAATDNSDDNEYSYAIIAQRTDPYKSFVMTGNFLTGSNASSAPARISVVGRDYLPNQTTINLNGSVHANPPAGTFGWNPF